MIFYNDNFYTAEDLKVSPLSDSYMYGYGVFETLRTYKGKIFCLEEHIDRLFKSAQIISLKENYTKDYIMKKTQETLDKSALKESRIKIVLTETELIIWSQELILKDPEWYKNGINVVTFRFERVMPAAKTLNNLSFILSKKYAKNKNVPEVLLIDRQGMLREGSYTNVFWIENGRLFTPKTNILKGVTRGKVLKAAKNLMEVEETDEFVTEVMKADEIFITSTISEIVPVVQIDEEIIGKGKVGEWTGKLMERFRKF